MASERGPSSFAFRATVRDCLSQVPGGTVELYTSGRLDKNGSRAVSHLMSNLLDWLNLLGIALGLAMDAFAVAVAAGMRIAPVSPRQTFRLAFHFGLFQFLMPVLGWTLGHEVAVYLTSSQRWIAFGLLAFVGGKMLWEAWQDRESRPDADPTRGLMLVTLSVATSIDALAVGMSMAFLGVSIWIPSVVIGLVAALLTAFGIEFGNRLGSRWGHWAETAGGCMLLLIGLKIVLGG
jgi:manganese efflux pump family protein